MLHSLMDILVVPLKQLIVFTLPFSYVSQFIFTILTFLSAVQILEKHQERFVSDIDAKGIAVTLKQESVIPEAIATDIANARSKTEGNKVLYDHLQSQATEDDLKRLFRVCSMEKGYSRMNSCGKDMLEELEQRGKLALALTLLKVTAALYDCTLLPFLLVLQAVLLALVQLLAGDEVAVTLPILLFTAHF